MATTTDRARKVKHGSRDEAGEVKHPSGQAGGPGGHGANLPRTGALRQLGRVEPPAIVSPAVAQPAGT